MEASDKIKVIKGIGDKTEKVFHKLGIETVQDLLEHYPRGYEEFERPVPISSLTEGITASIEAGIAMTPKLKKVRNLQIVNVQVKDSSASMYLTWFNMPFLQKSLRSGYHYIFRGKVVRKNGVLVMEQPGIYQKESYYKLLRIIYFLP